MKIRHLLSSFSAMALTAMISATAMGDDLEIYLGVGNQQVTYDPNVLFIMDTSGSMGSRDGGSETRILRVQNALKDVLGSATNINAGLMRFSDFGGPVLYPVRPIDDAVEPALITSVSSPGGDAHEINGVVTTGGNNVVLSQSTNTVTSGFRFDELNIPQGATITLAYLRFTSGLLNTSATDFTFAAEQVADAAEFTGNNNDISDRARTVSEVVWNIDNDWPLSGELVKTPDLTGVVQEVVDLADWCGGNAMNLIVQGVGQTTASARQILSYDEGSGSGAQLVVEYDDATATGCVAGEQVYQVNAQRNNAEENDEGYQSTGSELTFRSSSNDYIGVRFENIAVPQNVTIEEAYLEFDAYQSHTGSGAQMSIAAADEGNPDDFSPYTRYLLRNKPKTPEVVWSNIPPWPNNSVHQSPSLQVMVQQLVNRGDWQSGNAMMFIMSGFQGDRGALTYNGRPSGSARLHVRFRGNATPGTVTTVRDHLISSVDELGANGFTPIVDTLYEAVNYYGGREVDYGLTRGNSSVNSSVRRSTRVSHRLSYAGADAVRPSGCSEDDLSDGDCVNEYIPAGATYISPITDLQCQTNNHIVMLSDGVANNNHSVDEIEALLGESCNNGKSGERCGLDLVRNVSRSNESVIDSRIVTHTIGFAANSEANNFLNQLALQSSGTFHTADNSADLVEAFQSILRSVRDVNATFVSPGVAVNQLNRLTHRDELYFALFKPAEGTVWPGNLKRYRIDGDKILDRNGSVAIDSNTGFFSENSHSYWSVLADGNDVRRGGAASRLDLNRNVYTFSGTGNIMTSTNRLHEDNGDITTTDLAIDGESDPSVLRDDLLRWARGIDVLDADGDGETGDVRLQMGDPIHSQPVILNYTQTDSAVFVATNQGYLHSFDAATGEENFSIIPRELLGNLFDFYQNNSSFSHVYGLDGDLVLRKVADRYYLYVGMRRGGRNYYVVDVTNKTSPSIVFDIQGGSTGFEKLGQTWSRPTMTKVNIGGAEREVMIFGGGYDEDQDSKVLRSPDTIGNAVYMVDANTGALLWSASNADANLNITDMKYSIPARIAVIDRDTDGLADHMYVADTGGQVFRLDIQQGQTGNNLVVGGLLAQFSSDDSEANNRRFYYAPDVSEVSLGNELYYAVAIGSGFRAHPLNTVIEDKFYMIKDEGVFRRDENGHFELPDTPITASNLYDASSHLLTSADETVNQVENDTFANKQGWMISLASGGEKVLASPLILNFRILFTTYLPATASESQCAPPTGSSRVYLIDMVNGNALVDLDQDGNLEHEDRYADLQQTGIAPDTKILIEDIINPVVCLGTECAKIVSDVDENGDPEDCGTNFECLVEQLYGRFERVQRSSWTTETERE